LIDIKVLENKGQITAAAILGSLHLCTSGRSSRPALPGLHKNCGKQCVQGPELQAKYLIAIRKQLHASFLRSG
jgi:hypothetical protein